MHAAGDIKSALREHAVSLGFCAYGVAAPDAAAAQLPFLRAWLNAGYLADLRYMQRKPEARCDARSLLPGCASVIAVALPYAGLAAADPPLQRARVGKVARYAQGEDYHTAVASRLKQLAGRLSELAPGQQHKLTVDTSPIMEKAYAVAAGVGWRGRHTLVLNTEHGSGFMLGLLLTTAQLAPDEPYANACGACMRCIQACPTGALLEPGMLDAQRCISYWTTAVKGHVQPEIDLHGWYFGCDACQEACPYNSYLCE
jgi:epoxyqueuosine reductase